MDQYRVKDENVEACRLTKESVDDIVNWCGGTKTVEIDADEVEFVGVNVPTPHGVDRASEGDYVVKAVNGGFYPMKPDRFNDRFELA